MLKNRFINFCALDGNFNSLIFILHKCRHVLWKVCSDLEVDGLSFKSSLSE